MRYEARWSNGSWKLFDSHHYAAVDSFYLRREAAAAADRANARHG